MTEDEKKAVREMSNMHAFTFYLDDVTKYEALIKLKANGCDTKKGSLSALIRVLLAEFAATNNAAEVERIIAKVQEEYLFTTKKNKRSTM